MMADLERVLFDRERIERRVTELAAEITRDCAGDDLTVLALLSGSVMFLADLLRRIPLPLRLECARVASYRGGTSPAGPPVIGPGDLPDARGQDILILDDILDTGETLNAVAGALAGAGARRVRICVLLAKDRPRRVAIRADYVGFEIGDEFVVGYGLDFQGRYRNLPVIGVLRGRASGTRIRRRARGSRAGRPG